MQKCTVDLVGFMLLMWYMNGLINGCRPAEGASVCLSVCNEKGEIQEMFG